MSRLGDLMEIERGGSPRPISAFITDDVNGINWIKIGDAAIGSKFITSTREKITQEGAKRSRFVYPGDFIISNSMSFGRPYILKTTGCIHDGWVVLRNPAKSFDLDYLFWLITSPQIKLQFAQSAGGAVVKNLNIEKVKKAVVPVPPLNEQKRIAERAAHFSEIISAL